MNQTHDTDGQPYAKLSELKLGDKIELDTDFTCARPGTKILKEDGSGLYFECDEGSHYLRGQAKDGEHCVGVYLANA